MFTEYMARRRRTDGEIMLVHVEILDGGDPTPTAWKFHRSATDEKKHLASLPIIDECGPMLEEPHEIIQACA